MEITNSCFKRRNMSVLTKSERFQNFKGYWKCNHSQPFQWIVDKNTFLYLCQSMCFISTFRRLNPFVPNAPFLYSPKTSENRKVFLCFQGVEKGCTENKRIKLKPSTTFLNILLSCTASKMSE